MGQRLPKERPVKISFKPEPGAFAVSCRMTGRVEEVSKGDYKEHNDRVQLLVKRYQLLTAAQHEMDAMSVEEALLWVDLAIPMKTWFYNEEGSTSSLTGAASLLFEEIKWPLDHVRPTLQQDAISVIERLVFRDFWTGEQLSRDNCKWMPLIPCKYVDIRNMVCVNPRVDASTPFDKLLMTVPKIGAVHWESVREDTPLPHDRLPLNQLPERPKAVLEQMSTMVCEKGTAVVPRSSVVAWIARIYLYLVDKFGLEAVPDGYMDHKELLEYVKLERTYEEYWFEVLCSRLTKDFNPFVLMDASQRTKYATEVLCRCTDTLALPPTRDFEYTVTAIFEKRVATVVSPSGETFDVDMDDPDLDPGIKEAIDAFRE